MVMQTIQIRLPKGIITEIDKKVKTGFYANRSDFIRDHLRRKIEIKDLIGIIPNNGKDSVEEVRELRRKLSKERFDLKKINKLANF